MAGQRKQISNPPGVAPPYRDYYANAIQVTAGDLLFISGQVAWDDQGRVVGADDPLRQAEQVFANIARILEAHDATFAQIVKVTVYITSFSWFDQLSALRSRLFAESPPASVIVEVSRLIDPALLIEVDAVAAV